MKKNKRKKRKYITGIYNSLKCKTPIKYRSGWEKDCCQWFDLQKEIISYEYESFFIPYISNLTTGKERKYYPDFVLHFLNGTKKIIEVKRRDKLNERKTVKKLKAGVEWSKKNNAEFEIWTDNKIKQIRETMGIKPQKPIKRNKKRKTTKRKIQ